MYLQQVNNEHKYLMLRISERGAYIKLIPADVDGEKLVMHLSSIEMETVKMIMTTAAAT